MSLPLSPLVSNPSNSPPHASFLPLPLLPLLRTCRAGTRHRLAGVLSASCGLPCASFAIGNTKMNEECGKRGTSFASLKDYAPNAVEAEGNTISVLFVCLGNICRSPTAEAVFAHIVEKRGLTSKFKIDSAGTYGYHEGEPADSRMREAARKRGIALTSISRPIRPSDFDDFDLILAMDRKNLNDIRSAYHAWSKKTKLPQNGLEKVSLMCGYCTQSSYEEVPDPYYGGPEGFDKVLDLLEDACEGLLTSILAE